MTKQNVANNGGKWIRQDKRLAIYLRDDCCCIYCGAPMDEGHEMTIDHVRPQELGGSNKETNLVTACKACNSAKGAKSLRDFMVYLDAKGADTQGLAAKVRRHTRRSIKRLRSQAKKIIIRRKANL